MTAADPDGGYAGLTVGSFTSVSLDPPLVAFFPDKSSTTWPRLERAGRFCVNVLAADQEYICRAFAAKETDKFAGLDWRPAGSGSPILAGVSAWIDCDLEAVHDAGDHHIVVGRVRELDIENPSLPLLFFQGGYGRFMPQSLVTSDLKLIHHFRHIDLVRPELEALADRVGVECNASVRIGDEAVIIATAGQPRGTHISSQIGHRFAMSPPVGTLFVAWSEDAVVEAWLRRASPALSASDREMYREALDAIRRDGYALLVGTLDPRPADPTAAAVRPHVPRDLRRFVRDLRMGFGPRTCRPSRVRSGSRSALRSSTAMGTSR